MAGGSMPDRYAKLKEEDKKLVSEAGEILKKYKKNIELPVDVALDTKGGRIEVTMLEALGEWMGYPLYYTHYSGAAPPRTGPDHATIVPYGRYLTGDGKSVMLGMIAVIAATINVVGGFLVTDRMLKMFQKGRGRQGAAS